MSQGQYEKLLGQNPSGLKDSSDHPVENVTWDAVDDPQGPDKRASSLGSATLAGGSILTATTWPFACTALA